MLTNELLNGNPALNGLTDEQKAAIVEMSQNDENTVIGARIGEIYRAFDADILSTSGVEKNGAEKTYDYMKRAFVELKEGADANAANAAKVASLEKEKARLEKTIQEGGQDAEVKKELSKAKADLANVTKEYTELKTKYDEAETKHAADLLSLKKDGEFAAIGAGVNWKKDLPKSVTDILLGNAIAKVKAKSPEYIDDGKGGKVLAFNENGTVLRNPETNLAPFTAAELVLRELKGMGVLEDGRKQTGTGSHETHTGGADGVVDLSGAKSQVEADTLIKSALLSRGLTVGSMAYQREFDKIRTDNYDAIKALPLQ